MKYPVKRFKKSLIKNKFKIIIIAALSLIFSVYLSEKLYFGYFLKKVTGASIETNYGTIDISFRNDAPRAKENFIHLAKENYYDDVRFYRVVKNFLIETGDPTTKSGDLSKSKWGWGGPGYVFPDEIGENDLIRRGVVAMVNSGKDSNGSRFFIVADDAEWLDKLHTVFADVTGGMDVVDKIANVDVGVTGIPREDIVIEDIKLIYSK